MSKPKRKRYVLELNDDGSWCAHATSIVSGYIRGFFGEGPTIEQALANLLAAEAAGEEGELDEATIARRAKPKRKLDAVRYEEARKGLDQASAEARRAGRESKV